MKRAVVTGCIAQASIFTGINNFRWYGIQDEVYEDALENEFIEWKVENSEPIQSRKIIETLLAHEIKLAEDLRSSERI